MGLCFLGRIRLIREGRRDADHKIKTWPGCPKSSTWKSFAIHVWSVPAASRLKSARLQLANSSRIPAWARRLHGHGLYALGSSSPASAVSYGMRDVLLAETRPYLACKTSNNGSNAFTDPVVVRRATRAPSTGQRTATPRTSMQSAAPPPPAYHRPREHNWRVRSNDYATTTAHSTWPTGFIRISRSAPAGSASCRPRGR